MKGGWYEAGRKADEKVCKRRGKLYRLRAEIGQVDGKSFDRKNVELTLGGSDKTRRGARCGGAI